jgi:hypothetical protein
MPPVRRTLRVVLAAVLAVLVSGRAVAQGPEAAAPPANDLAEQLLQQAEKAYEGLEYETALKTLIKVHQVKGVTSMQRARSFLYMGVCFTALGNAESAVLSFTELLKVKPTFRLPAGISPSIQAMFKEALTRLKLPEQPPPEAPGAGGGGDGGGGSGGGGPGIPVTLTARTPGSVVVGQPVDVTIEVGDPQGLVEDIVIHWRLVGGPDYSMIRVKYVPGTAKLTGRIPGAVLATTPGKLHYLVEALGQGGMSLAHAGSMNVPLEVDLVAARKPKPTWGWWTLGIVGGAAVVGGIVAAVLLTRGGEPAKPNNTADVTLTIR